MVSSMFKQMRNFLFSSVAESDKADFVTGLNTINIARGKITAAAFIITEVIIIAASCIIRGENLFKKPGIYYAALYISLLLMMIAFLLVFTRFGKDIPRYEFGIRVSGILFAGLILLWCAGISLLDQLSSGQVIVYTVAILSVAITPFYEPLVLFSIYTVVQIVFLALMLTLFKSSAGLFGNCLNTTVFLIISWFISCMRYQKQAEDFKNKKLLEQKSAELNRMNKKLEAVNLELARLSQIDSLTGIFNRSVFDRTAKAEWDRCKRRFAPLSIIMIDIDFFKDFNDNYGHMAGDACLRQVAGVLSSCVRRSSDIVARYGGEEFAIILPHTEKESALELAEKMRSSVERFAIPHAYSSISEHITISVGVSTVTPSAGSSVAKLIETADKALYRAKQKRNNIVVA